MSSLPNIIVAVASVSSASVGTLCAAHPIAHGITIK